MKDKSRVKTVSDFGSLVREARRNLGLTQEQTAELCGVSVTYLYQLEKGKATIEFGKAIDVGRRLGIDLFACRR